MKHFYSLLIKKITKETDDAVSVTFDVPGELKETFTFVQGQNITIRKTFNGREVRRNYSICTSPLDKVLKIGIKKVEGGTFSTYAAEELKAGDVLEVMPPMGTFYTPLNPSHAKSYVAIAAGSGITPVLSIIKTTLLIEPHSNFTLVYGNRTKNSILFKEELEALKDKFIDRFRLYHILSREKTDAPINNGRIDKAKCEILFSKLINLATTDEFFLCGPEGLVFCVKDFLAGKGVKKEQIHFELFTVPGAHKAKAKSQKPEEEDAPASTITVKVDGVQFSFKLAHHTDSILEAALQQGADLPYACKGGVCTTCKAKLIEGEVSMDVNWGLEEDEVAKGFILTCQSHPVTETVVVDFDVNI